MNLQKALLAIVALQALLIFWIYVAWQKTRALAETLLKSQTRQATHEEKRELYLRSRKHEPAGIDPETWLPSLDPVPTDAIDSFPDPQDSRDEYLHALEIAELRERHGRRN